MAPMSTLLKRIRSRILVPIFLRVFLPILRALPLRSTIVGPVKQTAPSLAEYIEESRARPEGEKRQARHWIIRVDRELEIENPAPVLASPRLPRNYDQIRVLRCPETYLGHLRWGRLATHALEVISPDDMIFDDLYYARPSSRPTRSMITPLLPRARKKEGAYATICISRPSNYCHWICDCLTRLWILDVCGIDDFRLVVPKKSTSFQLQTLRMLGYGEERLAPFGHEHWIVEHLLVPSLTNRYRQVSPEACRWLRERFRSALTLNATSKRIYISRFLARKRRVMNEDELLRVLLAAGFDCVRAETMTAEAQAETFAQAEVVVAPHGAGLANMVFMKEGTLVIELSHYRKTKPNFYSMASALGIRYACITDAPEDPEDETDELGGDVDFAIPKERLESALQTLGI